MRQRHERTDEQWGRLAPLLPQPKRGFAPRDLRRTLNGILFLHATGLPWRDLPERYGPWRSVASPCSRGVQRSVWEHLFAALQQQGDAAGALDWSAHCVDGSVMRAHQHAASARTQPGRLLDPAPPAHRTRRQAHQPAADGRGAA